MSRVSIEQAYKPVEVDLWADKGGALFDAVPVTRGVQRALREIEEAALKAEAEATEATDDSAREAAEDRAVDFLARAADLRLKPKVDAKPKRKASTVIKSKWESDELTIPQFWTLFEQVAEQERPT